MEFLITNVKFENKYKGAYSEIFSILNHDRIFCEIYESDDSKGFVNNSYYLKISENSIDSNLLEKILKIKNVSLISNN